MKIFRKNGQPITRVNLLEWRILAEMFSEALMDFRRFMEDLVLAKEVKWDGCY